MSISSWFLLVAFLLFVLFKLLFPVQAKPNYWRPGTGRTKPAEKNDVSGSGNPFRAVSINPSMGSCLAAQAIRGERFLSAEAPVLPLKDCDVKFCKCRYAHYPDRRRDGRDRRASHGVMDDSPVFTMGGHDRRFSTGRRANDWAAA